MPARSHFSATAFGDIFDLQQLPLPRPADGYAVQRLDHDQLLDRKRQLFLPMRDATLEALFSRFSDAHAAASAWLDTQGLCCDTYPLAIVPAAFDPRLKRHILIYGVLRTRP